MTEPAGRRDWDPNPVYELGNAWITFGNLLDEKLAEMSGATLDLSNGSWEGDSSMAMDFAFNNTLQPTVMTAIDLCWTMGERINYYAMLRTQQQETEYKQEVANGIAVALVGVLGFVFSFI